MKDMKLIPIDEYIPPKTCWNCHFMTTQAPFYCYKINKIRKKSHICDEHRYFNPDQMEVCGDRVRTLKRRQKR